ncbi:hypothetical protein BaRGS_00026348 [Batillaria attramentaria]|uniref:Uncharacterized protein n=1 Tax=Batillaria attramentaria TaxID=370345 RepID=A0ABD0K637_9CAEN
MGQICGQKLLGLEKRMRGDGKDDTIRPRATAQQNDSNRPEECRYGGRRQAGDGCCARWYRSRRLRGLGSPCKRACLKAIGMVTSPNDRVLMVSCQTRSIADLHDQEPRGDKTVFCSPRETGQADVQPTRP